MNDDHYRRALIDDIVASGTLIPVPKTIEDDIVEILSAETKKAIEVNEANNSVKATNKHRLFNLPAPVKLKAKQNENDSTESNTGPATPITNNK